jgi:dihydroflavonol-4-reductase
MLTLVTGASGHIGSLIAQKLAARGRKIRVLVRENSIRLGLPKDAELVVGDILDIASLDRAMQGVERLFHCAAVFQTRFKDESEREEMIRTNVEGTRNVLEAAKRAGVKRVVYTSSVAALGITRDPSKTLDESYWNEDPIDAYVASKTEAERLAHSFEGLDIVHVLPGTVIGPGDYKPQPNNDFIIKAMTKAPPIYFANGHSYVDAEDVAEGHLLAEEKGKSGERYILAGENIDIRALFNKVGRRPFIKVGHLFVSVVGLAVELKAKLLGQAPLFTRAKAHKLIDYYGYFDSSKAMKELGYRYRNVDEVLQRCRSWYKERGWI